MNETRELQLHQLKILEQVIALFEEEGLTYFAIGGTALGAFRHQGFIPWDDDIDIGMPRADYDKFLTLQTRLPENLFIQHYSTDPDYPLYIAKVRDSTTRFVEKRYQKLDINHGIFIDIFPWDNIQNLTSQKKSCDSAFARFRRCNMNKYKKKSPLKFLKTLIYKAIYGFKTSQKQFNELDQEHKFFNNISTNALGNASFKDTITHNALYPLKKIQFESIQINCPNNMTKYLTDKYGDYMRIPEEKDRITHNPIEICFNINK
ncbi:hypothetical protein CXF72_16140 [Psychromonas sp. MB-3u-54]|uniref:LicD family protein n=1 Tax=Psychromonas sp. MB-3u-54 TaxID=2058319 RepID=UPI000C327C8B|nr:LicD family protein [Psychromonas sp. MB-3u-54]PKH01601.1 hypothetical protein CXF72_16140 [Psychromonas sp. MB-3u-54]